MPKNYAQPQQSLTFDELMRSLDEQFQTIPDKRTGNAVTYKSRDVLKAAFAMFSLKCPSLEIAILYAKTGPREEGERPKFLRQLLTLIK